MPSRQVIDSFLARKNLALVGVSGDPKGFSNAVFRRLRDDGHTMYAVNARPELTELEGQPCYHSLAEVPDPVDGVVVMVPAPRAAQVVRDALDRGVRAIWLHRGGGEGAVSEEAVRLCREAGADVVDGACPLMFSGEVRGIHRFHRAFVGRRLTA